MSEKSKNYGLLTYKEEFQEYCICDIRKESFAALDATVHVGTRNNQTGPLEIQFHHDKSKDLDLLMTYTLEAVISKRLTDLICRICPEQVQFFDTDHPDFFVLNILNHVECFDFQNSVYTLSERSSDPELVMKLRVIPEKAAGFHLFKVKEWPLPIIVSPDLIRHIHTLPDMTFRVKLLD